MMMYDLLECSQKCQRVKDVYGIIIETKLNYLDDNASGGKLFEYKKIGNTLKSPGNEGDQYQVKDANRDQYQVKMLMAL